MHQLADIFSRYLTPENRAEIERNYTHYTSTGNSNIRAIPPHPATTSNPFADLQQIDDYDPAKLAEVLESLQVRPTFPLLDVLPCANVDAAHYTTCFNPGTKTCSECKLASYCSKECQKHHWHLHKLDCRSLVRSDSWKPSWVTEGRRPSFICDETLQEEFTRRTTDEFAIGASLWGNTPAMDVINLLKNENDSKKNFSLAFIASGDLRHAIKTVNSLPSNYSGELKIALNDASLPVVSRNIILLLILGTIADEAMASDVALHLWYSAFIPSEYKLQISTILMTFLNQADEDGNFKSKLGPWSTLHSVLLPETMKYFLHFVSSEMSIGDAQEEYDRVRMASSRRDYWDRMYAGLNPSHRLALQEFRRFGIVLPFGAPNAHFNVPNQSLFSYDGKWLQRDFADPLEGWDISEVIAAGGAHGAQPEDTYGCQYFFLSDQLRDFARRLRKFKVSFLVSSFDVRALCLGIRENTFSDYGIPSSVRFDRIHVSNILDHNYVGIRQVLSDWAPFLAETKSAAIVGYFMNWVALQKNGRASSQTSSSVIGGLVDKLKQQGRLTGQNLLENKNALPNFGDLGMIMYLSTPTLEAVYDNSKAFATFLKNQGLDTILRETKLKKRQRHTIVPHRLGAPLHGSPETLPEFLDDTSWYHYIRLSRISWYERYVEFVRA
ncbi:hypothetical protein BDQ12DRAFT_705388 [Crucibulum laeve]|uniref:MYND-type domain-containing protein n=1 Tax=Crucibulum laeve TaxID=68775 RepID=A0A5C3LZR6_9AGAR|nr:hypothetical protein BDQ12DRAFT_705388 [Crucibulum laeve]